MGQAIEITHLKHTASELREVAGRTRDGRVVQRLLAVALVLDGKSRSDAAHACGMDRQILRDWVVRFNEAGVEGLTNRAVPGRPPRLSTEQMQALRRIVLDGPDLEVHGVIRWRCVDLQGVIAERFGVRLHESTIGKLLRRLNLTRLQPRPAHPGKSVEAEAAFKKTSARLSAQPSPIAPMAGRSKSGSRTKPA
jgi:transposase